MKPGKLTGYDPAKLNQYLASILSPVPEWQKLELELAGKTIGIIYVPRARERPLVVTKDDGDLREGDILYRYPGETRRIKHAELVGIIQERAEEVQRYWADVLGRINRAGVQNVAIFDTASGEVSGRTGSFLIDEALLPQVKFITEGHFTEKEGAPALRLIGYVEPVGPAGAKGAVVIKHGLITDADHFSDFASRAVVPEPALYVQRSAYSNRKWLPIYYYLRLAGLTIEDGIKILNEQKDARPHHLEQLIERLEKRHTPRGAAKPPSTEPERGRILDETIAAPVDENECVRLVKAVRALKAGELNPDFLLPLLGHCLETFPATQQAVQYALCHLDVIWQLQVEAAKAGTHD
jgi:hypothetical protein